MKPWSLRAYLTRWIALTTGLIALIVAGGSSFVVQGAIEREIQAFVEEELGEMQAHFSVTHQRPTDFEFIVMDLAQSHPQNSLAWMVWKTENGANWGRFGDLSLFEGVEPDRFAGGLVTYGDRCWGVSDLAEGLTMGLLIDAAPQLQVAKRFYLFAGAFVLLASVVSTLTASWIGRRTSRMLKGVAAQARTVRSTQDDFKVPIDHAPEEIREVAEALDEMLQNIQDEAANSQLITSGLAHELRSPIQNLMGETEVALIRDREPGEYRQVLRSNMEELRHLSRAVDNLVMLCGAGEANRSRGRERFDLGREADLRLDRERSHAARRDVKIEVSKRGNLEVEGDREAILLVMRNLVTNAVDWSPEGGRVHVNLAGENGRVELEVADGGPGIPEAERSKIFEAFYRSPSLNGGRIGYGLGLALTRSAVESHGGSISVGASEVGGARFQVDLPREAS